MFLWLSDITSAPHWPRYWWLRPLLVVPVAGAIGGAVFHFLLSSALPRWMVYPLALLIYLIGLWLGTVVGLDGTLWN